VNLPFMPEDPRIVDSTGALNCARCPSMLVIGGGIIGLEMATVYSTLGARIDVVEMMDGLMQGADRDGQGLAEVERSASTTSCSRPRRWPWKPARGHQGHVRRRDSCPPTPEPQCTTWCCSAGGRSPNGKKVGRQGFGVMCPTIGFIPSTSRCALACRSIFAIGDLIRPAHAGAQGGARDHVALPKRVWREDATFDASVIPAISYTDPEVGMGRSAEDKPRPRASRSRRASSRGPPPAAPWPTADAEGFTKLLFEAETHRIIGGGIVGTHAGDMIGGAGHRDGCGRRRHRQDHPPAPDPGRVLGMAAKWRGIAPTCRRA
jgi:dihydrolipoamide dehydrogenase